MNTNFGKIILIFLHLLSACSIYAQSEFQKYEKALEQTIRKHILYTEPNFTHEEEAEAINNFFLCVFDSIDYYSDDQKKNIRNEAFQLLYKHSISGYEDMPDALRMDKRRMTFLQIMALTADSERYRTFLRDAGYIAENLMPEAAAQETILNKLLCLLLDIKRDKFFSEKNLEIEIKRLKIDLSSRQELLSPDFYEDVSDLLVAYSADTEKIFKLLIDRFELRKLPYNENTNFDNFDFNTILFPREIEMLQLKSITEFSDTIEGFSTKLYANCQLRLSDNFITLAITYPRGDHELHTYLINCGKDLSFIDLLEVAYDEVAESAFRWESTIEKDKITRYFYNWMNDQNDPLQITESYTINEKGKFMLQEVIERF